jgi:hypothetical protein
MKVSPAHSFAPANLHVLLRVEPDERNRTLSAIADSEEFYRSTEVQLDGDRAPRTIAIEFPAVPGGEYRVSSVVLDSSGRPRARVSQQVYVVPTMQ